VRVLKINEYVVGQPRLEVFAQRDAARDRIALRRDSDRMRHAVPLVRIGLSLEESLPAWSRPS